MTWQTSYQSEQDCIFRQEHCAQEDNTFDDFLQEPVAACPNDTRGHNALTEHLRGISLTGLGLDALEKVPIAEALETRDWTLDEALIEAMQLRGRISYLLFANVWISCRSKFGVRP